MCVNWQQTRNFWKKNIVFCVDAFACLIISREFKSISFEDNDFSRFDMFVGNLIFFHLSFNFFVDLFCSFRCFLFNLKFPFLNSTLFFFQFVGARNGHLLPFPLNSEFINNYRRLYDPVQLTSIMNGSDLTKLPHRPSPVDSHKLKGNFFLQFYSLKNSNLFVVW